MRSDDPGAGFDFVPAWSSSRACFTLDSSSYLFLGILLTLDRFVSSIERNPFQFATEKANQPYLSHRQYREVWGLLRELRKKPLQIEHRVAFSLDDSGRFFMDPMKIVRRLELSSQQKKDLRRKGQTF